MPTFDLQLAGDGSLSLGVLGSAGVHATIEAARLPNFQRANALMGDLPKLRVISDDHLILQPLNFRLRGEKAFIHGGWAMNLENSYILKQHGIAERCLSL